MLEGEREPGGSSLLRQRQGWGTRRERHRRLLQILTPARQHPSYAWICYPPTVLNFHSNKAKPFFAWIRYPPTVSNVHSNKTTPFLLLGSGIHQFLSFGAWALWGHAVRGHSALVLSPRAPGFARAFAFTVTVTVHKCGASYARRPPVNSGASFARRPLPRCVSTFRVLFCGELTANVNPSIHEHFRGALLS